MGSGGMHAIVRQSNAKPLLLTSRSELRTLTDKAE